MLIPSKYMFEEILKVELLLLQWTQVKTYWMRNLVQQQKKNEPYRQSLEISRCYSDFTESLHSEPVQLNRVAIVAFRQFLIILISAYLSTIGIG